MENPNSIVSCLRAARGNSRTVREAISSEMWEQVNTSYLAINAAASNPLLIHSPYSFFNEVKKASQLFDGVAEATMLRGEGWHFFRMGRLVERADKTSRLLDVKYYILLPSLTDVGTPLDDIQWAAVLRSASALEMYRKRHGHIAPEQIVEFLVLDHEFPRSIHHCLTRANDSLHSISGTPVGIIRNPAEQRLGQLRAELAYADTRTHYQARLARISRWLSNQAESRRPMHLRHLFCAPPHRRQRALSTQSIVVRLARRSTAGNSQIQRAVSI